MIIIRPVEITDAVLAVTDVPEADAPEWIFSNVYAIDTEVMRTVAGTHSVYVSLEAGNTENYPEDDDPVTPVHWARVRATNRWAMFSDQINDQTTQADEINVTLTPAALVNAMAFFNLDAATIHIVMDDPVEGVVYDETYSLVDASGVNDWYAWYFEPIVRQKTLAVLDLPPFITADILVTIEDTGDTAECGLVTMGAQRKLGDTDYGTGVGVVDYSRKDRDTFGNPVITPRNFTKRSDYSVTVDTAFVDAVQNTLAELRTVPATWIGSVNFPSTIIYGYYRDFNIVLSNPTKSLMTIDVEGLT
jgi:hypothetical protein